MECISKTGRDKDLMQMFDLNEAISQLAMVSSVHW